MLGILIKVAEHSQNIQLAARPFAQQLHRFDNEKCKAIDKEVAKLLAVGFVREIHHPTWVVNHVLVKKWNRSWTMCDDYTSLNKACSKDPFPLPCIDQVVDSTSWCELLSFLDAYSGYHQIAMKETDQHSTTFITPFETFCYVSMPFG